MYKLNEIPVRTTNGFNINDLNIDLDIPKNIEYKDFIINNIDDIEIKTSYIGKIDSKIGLTLENVLNIEINITKKINKPVELIYEFDDDHLTDNIVINCKKNSSANIVIKYISKTDKRNFHHLRNIINLEENSNLNLTIVNFLNTNSINMIASESYLKENSTLTQNLIDLGGNTKINNYYSECLDNSKSYLNNIYTGIYDDIIDMNYHFKNIGKNSITNIESQGLLDDTAKKNFRGTIDFISGCSKSIGKENENCVLLSDDCVSRSVPILLCGEEDVEGAHSVSSGKIDEEKLFYIMSRGINKEEAEKMLVLSNFDKVLNNLDDSLKESIIDKLNEII